VIEIPELPDVEAFRRYSRKALNKKIMKISVKQKKIIEVSESTLRRHLSGNRFTGTSRHGKYLFLKISDGYNLVLHFGMTGDLCYYKKEKPDHIALDIELSNGYSFSVISVRKLGEIDIVKDKEDFIEDKGLGPDALSVSKNKFVEIMEKNKGMIKTKLMDQSKVAGLGNIYTDEILFQTGIHPEKKDIDKKEYGKLYNAMKNILKIAIDKKGEREKFPKDYLIPRRVPISRNKKDADKCPKCSGKIKNKKVGGRSTYYCAKHQKK